MNNDYYHDRSGTPAGTDAYTDGGKDPRLLRNSILVVVILIAAAAALRFLPGIFRWTGSEAWTQEFSADIRQIDVDCISCDVVLVPVEKGPCRVEYTGSRRYECTAEEKKGSLTVTEKTRAPWFFFTLRDGDTRLTVYLPAEDCDISLESTSGDLMLPEAITAGTVRLDTTSGDVSVSGLRSGTLSVETVSGEVMLSDSAADGAASFDTTSGDIDISGFEADAISVDTVSGEVTAEDAEAGSVEVSTTSGDVRLVLRRAMDYATSTVSGNVSVGEPDRSGGACRVRTISGDIRIDALS